ncbi:MAG: HAMP domain-containing histidine kinase [Oscillospiraceae bacterium]|nr:HAMP domain-containing histidine kinase [Oscillospiraceae bacterium]
MNSGTRERGRLWIKVTAFVCLVLATMIFAGSALATIVLYYSDAYYLDNYTIIDEYISNEVELKKNLTEIYLSYYEPFGYSAEALDEAVFYDSYDYETSTYDATAGYSYLFDDEFIEYYAINYDEYDDISPLFGFYFYESETSIDWLEEIFSVSYSESENLITEEDLNSFSEYIEIYYPEGRSNFRIDVSNSAGETLYSNYVMTDGDDIDLTSESEDYTVTVMGEPMVIEVITYTYEEAANCLSVFSELDDLVKVLGFEISITQEEDAFNGEIVYCTHIVLSQVLSETLTVTASLPSNLADFTVQDDVYIKLMRINTLLTNKDNFIVLMVLTAIVALVCFIVLMTTAGHFPEHDGIRLTFADKIPMELYLIPVCIVLYGSLYIISESAYIDIEARLLQYLVFALCAGVSAAVVMLVFMTSAARIKARRFFKNTVVFGSLIWFFSFIGKLIRNRKYATKLKFIFIGVLVYDFLCLLLLFVDAFLGLIAFFIGNIAVLIAAIVYAMGVRKLEEAARDISEGKTETVVDSDGLYFGLGRFAGYLNSINDGIQTAVDESLRSERLKTELITNVSHDLKTPLTSIVNYVDILSKEDIQPDSAREYVDVLVRQSQRMKKLIDDLVEASKAQAGAINATLERTDMSILLTQATAEYEDRLEANGLKLIVSTPENPLMALADGRLMWRVFDNLMGNILKYAQHDTRVYVSAEENDGRIRIIFKNISKYELNISSDELMERFVRGDSSRSTEGSGLGLSIAKSLCALNNVDFNIIIDGDLYKAELTMDELAPEPDTPREETLPAIVVGEEP